MPHPDIQIRVNCVNKQTKNDKFMENYTKPSSEFGDVIVRISHNRLQISGT
jgi:hypothetical protein